MSYEIIPIADLLVGLREPVLLLEALMSRCSTLDLLEFTIDAAQRSL